MSRIIQVYDEEKQINTQVRRFNESTDVLSPSTEALRNVFMVYYREPTRSTLKKNEGSPLVVFVTDLRGLKCTLSEEGALLDCCCTYTKPAITFTLTW